MVLGFLAGNEPCHRELYWAACMRHNQGGGPLNGGAAVPATEAQCGDPMQLLRCVCLHIRVHSHAAMPAVVAMTPLLLPVQVLIFPFFTYCPTSGWLGDMLPKASPCAAACLNRMLPSAESKGMT